MMLQIILIFLAALWMTDPTTITVPRGSDITIDGKLSAGEWDDALKQELKGGGELRIKHDGTYLYLGLRGLKDGWSHVYLTDGQTIYVLHASAALGSVAYRQSGDAWQTEQKFNWELRDRTMSEQAVAARAAYLEKNGWVASIHKMGAPAEIEFKIARRMFGGKEPMIAALYADTPTAPLYWPATLKDDCLKDKLIMGNPSGEMKFDRATWARLKL
jgi:hypothetical protein